MQISFRREDLLKALGYVVGVIERRQILPILSYALLKQVNGETTLTGTDLEIEIVAKAQASEKTDIEIALPARKLFEICRALSPESIVIIKKEGDRAVIKAGRSRFVLTTLPAADFPSIQSIQWEQALTIKQRQFKAILQQTHFCMAQQDVRYYLNGLLLEFNEKTIRSVATDGHRMAISETKIDHSFDSSKQIIVPRKGVQEIQRLLSDSDTTVEIRINTNHFRIETEEFTFTSKLIDGRYPDYVNVVPLGQTKMLRLVRDDFKETLSRVAILSSDKYHGVRVSLDNKSLRITAHNPEQEEAQEEIVTDYGGEAMEIGFNVNYIVEAVSALDGPDIILGLSDSNSSCTITAPEKKYPQYVIMPMRL